MLFHKSTTDSISSTANHSKQLNAHLKELNSPFEKKWFVSVKVPIQKCSNVASDEIIFMALLLTDEVIIDLEFE